MLKLSFERRSISFLLPTTLSCSSSSIVIAEVVTVNQIALLQAKKRLWGQYLLGTMRETGVFFEIAVCNVRGECGLAVAIPFGAEAMALVVVLTRE